MDRLGFGFKVGHYTDHSGATGCTVVLPPAGNVASCDIRGSSPGSRELALLHPDRRLTEIHALLLTGGSAFGLAAADGVVGWLEERGVGYQTPAATVPIVPAAVVYDLGAAQPGLRPGPAAGRAACEAATEDGIETGRVGAGTGATVGKWAGFEHAFPGGLGLGRASAGEHEMRALAVVNAVGDVIDHDGSVVAGTTSPDPGDRALMVRRDLPSNTVLAVVVTRSNGGKRAARWLAARGSDGITVSIRPAHTPYDGDVVFCVLAPDEPGAPEAPMEVLGVLATRAVADAVRNAVREPR